MRPDLVALDAIQRLPRNSKLHDIQDLGASFGEFGFVDRVIINEVTGHLLSGHGRCDALAGMKKRGQVAPDGVQAQGSEWLVPVDYVACPAQKEDALALRLNVSQMKGGDYDLEEILRGFDANTLADVLADEQTAVLAGLEGAQELLQATLQAQEPIDAEPEEGRGKELRDKWNTAVGQVWRLGRHLVACGDCTDLAVWEKIGGMQTDVAFADPPYNIGYKYQEYDDTKSPEEYRAWCEIWFRMLRAEARLVILTVGQWNQKMWLDIEKPLGTAIWIARNKTSGSPIAMFSNWEPILLYGKLVRRRRTRADVIEEWLRCQIKKWSRM